MSKKKKGPEVKKGLDGWFATYSDMVTLLFCFFVLLYASSTQDETRFQYIFQAFSSEGRYINTIVGKNPETPREGESDDLNSDIPPVTPGDDVAASPGQTNQHHVFESLYTAIAEVIEDSDLQDSIEVSAAPGQVRIRFQNDVLFDGDSYELKPLGKQALDLITPTISAVQEYIASVQVQGHTADVGSTNVVIDPWDLSSLRAASVVKYLDEEKQMADSEKFLTEGFAEHVPIARNDTAEGRAANRRVEIIVTRHELSADEHRYVDAVMQYDYNQPTFGVDAHGERIEQLPPPIESVVNSIINDLEMRYGVPAPEDDAAQNGSSQGSGSSSQSGGSRIGPEAGSLTHVSPDDYELEEGEEPIDAGDGEDGEEPADGEETENISDEE